MNEYVYRNAECVCVALVVINALSINGIASDVRQLNVTFSSKKRKNPESKSLYFGFTRALTFVSLYCNIT